MKISKLFLFLLLSVRISNTDITSPLVRCGCVDHPKKNHKTNPHTTGFKVDQKLSSLWF